MTDVLREKYRRLFASVQELEDRVADLASELQTASESPNPADAEVVEQELRSLKEELTAKRNELTRLSDGCGKPHPQN